MLLPPRLSDTRATREACTSLPYLIGSFSMYGLSHTIFFFFFNFRNCCEKLAEIALVLWAWLSCRRGGPALVFWSDKWTEFTP